MWNLQQHPKCIKLSCAGGKVYGAKGKTGGYYTNAGYTSKEADGEKGDYVVWAPRYPQPLPV